MTATVPQIVASGGAVEVDGNRVSARSSSGTLAAAGDGLATAIVAAVLSGGTDQLSPTDGTVRVVREGESDLASGAPLLGIGVAETAISVDMTNWSVIVDGRFVVKVVSEWNGADRAARLLSRLAAAESTVIPRYRGRLEWTRPGSGSSTIALVSDVVPGSTDGWTWAVDDVLGLLDGGPHPEWPARLGTLAATLHVELSTAPSDGATTTSAPGGTALRARADAALETALATVGGGAGVRLRNRVTALREVIATIPDDQSSVPFEGHGDLHVGQVLRDPGHRLWLIDFDGDPQLGHGERERPDVAARDLAHLLISVDLVGSIARRRAPGTDVDVLAWAESARAELLDAYVHTLAERGASHLLDARVLPGFEVEQLVRELLYADTYLERWGYAPDAVISHRYAPTTGTTEDPWTPPVFSTI